MARALPPSSLNPSNELEAIPPNLPSHLPMNGTLSAYSTAGHPRAGKALNKLNRAADQQGLQAEFEFQPEAQSPLGGNRLQEDAEAAPLNARTASAAVNGVSDTIDLNAGKTSSTTELPPPYVLAQANSSSVVSDAGSATSASSATAVAAAGPAWSWFIPMGLVGIAVASSTSSSFAQVRHF